MGRARWTEPKVLALWSVLLAALLTWANAGDGDGPGRVGAAFALWLAHAAGGLGFAAVTTLAWQRVLGSAGPVWLTLTAGGLTGALLFTPIALGLEFGAASLGISGTDDAVPKGAALGPIPSLLVSEFLDVAPPFLLLWLVANAAYLGVKRVEEGAAARPDAALPAPASAAPEARGGPGGLLQRLPPALGRNVLALQADVNYLHVHTDQGRTMLLYSLTRACDELGDAGLRVHRGYWVARGAVVQVRQTGDHLTCRLCNGLEVPVSRRRKAAVIEQFGRDFSR